MMTPERIAELLRLSDPAARQSLYDLPMMRQALGECLSEIVRLQAALDKIADAPTTRTNCVSGH